MDLSNVTGFRLLEETIGHLSITIQSDEYVELPAHHKVIAVISEEEPQRHAIGILYALAMMSFFDAEPRDNSELQYNPEDYWQMTYFVEGLEFTGKSLRYSADYLAGKMINTDIEFTHEGELTIETRRRGKVIDNWLDQLLGKPKLRRIK